MSSRTAIVAFLLLAYSISGFARDMGVIGTTYNIAERDLITVLEERFSSLRETGKLETLQREWRESIQAQVRRPMGRSLPSALAYRVVEISPEITIAEAIHDAEGNILYPAGTTINPLEYRPLSKTLCFFDGSNAVQVDWVHTHCTEQINNKLILVNGDIGKLSTEYPYRYYFDQQGVLVDRFDIQALPALVRQSGSVLYVEQLPVL